MIILYILGIILIVIGLYTLIFGVGLFFIIIGCVLEAIYFIKKGKSIPLLILLWVIVSGVALWNFSYLFPSFFINSSKYETLINTHYGSSLEMTGKKEQKGSITNPSIYVYVKEIGDNLEYPIIFNKNGTYIKGDLKEKYQSNRDKKDIFSRNIFDIEKYLSTESGEDYTFLIPDFYTFSQDKKSKIYGPIYNVLSLWGDHKIESSIDIIDKENDVTYRFYLDSSFILINKDVISHIKKAFIEFFPGKEVIIDIEKGDVHKLHEINLDYLLVRQRYCIKESEEQYNCNSDQTMFYMFTLNLLTGESVFISEQSTIQKDGFPKGFH